MKLWNKFVIVIIVFLFFLNIDCAKEISSLPPPIDPSDYVKPVSDKISVRIYFDATVSMRGFVYDTYTDYVQLLPSLASAVVRGWKESKVDYYKFGSDILPISGSGYLPASKKEFYEDDKINRETNIQKVIEHSDPKSLNIIVTDLFQTDSDTVLITNKLKEKYLQKGLAVGLLGIRSQYDGIVYDVGISREKNYYKSDDYPESFRPFYLIMLGEYSNIDQYFNKLILAGTPYISKDSFTIFSYYLVKAPSSFDGAKINRLENLRETNRLLPREALKDPRIRQFEARIKRRRAGPSNIEMQLSLKYRSLEHTIPFDPNQLECEIIAKKNESKNRRSFSGRRENTTGELIPIDARSFVIQDIKLTGKDLKFTARLDPYLLQGKGIYSYQIVIRPYANAYKIPEWCQKWNMGTVFDGSKTVNLIRFVGDLLESTIQSHQPKIAEFYCYIRI